jgi:hypothetical protein
VHIVNLGIGINSSQKFSYFSSLSEIHINTFPLDRRVVHPFKTVVHCNTLAFSDGSVSLSMKLGIWWTFWEELTCTCSFIWNVLVCFVRFRYFINMSSLDFFAHFHHLIATSVPPVRGQVMALMCPTEICLYALEGNAQWSTTTGMQWTDS